MNDTETQTRRLDLYHGTSSVFLPSIRKHGLGGHDPVAESNAVACLTKLYSLAQEVVPPEDGEWILLQPLLKPMVEQRVSGTGFNFRHGKTYLTPSRQTAIRYATSYQLGSELISSVKGLHDLISVYAPDAARELISHYPALDERLQLSGTPVVIKLSQFPLRDLKAEDGQDATEIVCRIGEFESVATDSEMRDALLQQCNFELQRAVPYSSLLFYTVFQSSGGDYSLVELPNSAIDDMESGT